MLIIGHTAIGVGIGLLAPNPAVAFVLGVVSHHLADWTPHFDPGSFYPEDVRKSKAIHTWNQRDYIFVAIDMMLTIVMVALFIPHLPAAKTTSIIAATFGALLPDILHNIPFWNKQLRQNSFIR